MDGASCVEGSIETALARYRLHAPGLRVVISDRKFDPTSRAVLLHRNPCVPADDGGRGRRAPRGAPHQASGRQRALRIARDILDLDEFRDLALPGGLAKRGRAVPTATARQGASDASVDSLTPTPARNHRRAGGGSATRRSPSKTPRTRTAGSGDHRLQRPLRLGGRLEKMLDLHFKLQTRTRRRARHGQRVRSSTPEQAPLPS